MEREQAYDAGHRKGILMSFMHRLAQIISEKEASSVGNDYKLTGPGERVLQKMSSISSSTSASLNNKGPGNNGVRRFPRSATRRYDDFEYIRASSALILGDAEIPDHDADTFELAADVAEREKIRTLIIAGDFVALDSFSTWKKSTGTVYNFANELAPAIESLKVFIKIFDNVIYITGNHERRISRQTDGNIILGYFLEGLDVKFSEYAYCVLESSGERFLVCHPDNYSSQPCTVPRGLAVTNNMHVIAGHTHRQSFCLAPNGIHYAIETGHCRDVLRTQYKALRTNLHPEWQNGFVVVMDGVPLLVNKYNHSFIGRQNGRAA